MVLPIVGEPLFALVLFLVCIEALYCAVYTWKECIFCRYVYKICLLIIGYVLWVICVCTTFCSWAELSLRKVC